MKNVIISGATSMLGLALIDECIKNDTFVTAIIRENSQKKHIIPDSELVTVLSCDVSKIERLAISIRKEFDAFYHFAWEGTANTDRNIVDLQNLNIGYTLAAVSLAQQLECKRFIGAGSQAEYGRVAGVISPEMKVSPDNAYGIAKFAAGRLSGILAEQLGIEFIWTRIFSTYGINDMSSTMIMYCIDSLLKNEKPQLTKCDQQWDYLNCRDAARAFFLLGEKGKDQEIYNIGSGVARPLKEYVYSIRDVISPKLPLGIGEISYAPKQVMHLCPDISNLEKDTGFYPQITFEEGINETIEWYRGKQNEDD